MLNRNYRNLLSINLLSVLLIACNTQVQNTPVEDLKKTIVEIHPQLFKASDVAKIIEESEADYMPSITLATDIIDVYMDGDSLEFLSNEILAAALMGMYTADVGYHLAFLNRDAAFESYTAAQLIANELGFGAEFRENLLSRHASDTFKIAAMLDELDNALIDMDTSYSDSDRSRILVGFIAANYIQKQYHIHATIQSYKQKEIDDELKLLLSKQFVLSALSQQVPLNSLIVLIEKNQYAEDKGEILAELTMLRDIFSRISPLNENFDAITPPDVFENEDFDAMYQQISLIQTRLTKTLDN